MVDKTIAKGARMKIEIMYTNTIDILDPKLDTISNAFKAVMKNFLRVVFNEVLINFAEKYYAEGIQFRCSKCKSNHLKWKTRHGPDTKIYTVFSLLKIRQLLLQCTDCGHSFYITRQLLGIAPRKIMTKVTCEKLALIGSLATYRVSEKIISLFGWTLDKMTVWRCVQKTGKEINFDLDLNELPRAEADGTGIPIQNIKKRGKELKIVAQSKKNGGIRIAGISIGRYDKDWSALFKPLVKTLKKFKLGFFLVTDGDTGALKALKGKVQVIYQRCLWHIPHQFKWYLWKDGVKRKSTEWRHALGELYEISAIRDYVEDVAIIESMVTSKRKRLDNLIQYCKEHKYKRSTAYLFNAQCDMFTGIQNRLRGFTTSLVERVMRTVNLRINVGKWSTSGALNACKIRLAYYYNEWDVK